MTDNKDFDIINDPGESEQVEILIEDETCNDDDTFEEVTVDEDKQPESEFEKELENYLPTFENTSKVKKPLPGWVFSAIASLAVCTLFFIVYTVLMAPNLRPKAIISYSGGTPTQSETIENPKNSLAKAADSVVTITGTSSYYSFFGVSSSQSTSSGVVLSEDGYILTANSALGQEGIVVSIDGEEFEASVQGVDASKDIAIIKIEKTGLVPAVLGNSDNALMGDSVFCLGNVLGDELGVSATRGIICGINRDVNINSHNFNLLQTDAKTSSGNAGGPLVNIAGEVIGMITYSVNAESSGISFAIPSNDIKNVAQALITTGEAPKGLVIGITGTDTDHGVVVDTVIEDTPAEKAGITDGDLILRVDDTAVKSISDINRIKDSHVSGDKLKITLYRDGELLDIEVTL